MTDPIRAALERAARELGRAGDQLMMFNCLNLGRRAKNEAHAARAALAAPTPEPDTDAVLKLAAAIREVWGSRMLGAAALAEAILSHPAAREVLAAPTLPADGETEELIWRLGWIAAQLSDIGWEDDSTSVARAAALLRQLPPEGLQAIRYSVVDDGAVIQRTSWPLESWAVRSGSSCMSTTGEWDIEPMPSERTDEWLANHRWPSAAAAWAALQQARRQEVGQ